MRKLRYELEGTVWLPIARAAKLLKTNASGVRTLMGSGVLEWRQTRANSRTFVVAEDAVMKLRAKLPGVKFQAKKKPSPKAPEFEPVRRARGGLWQEHHLRLTLPHLEEDEEKNSKK
jgi:hypothetical protein